MVGVAGRSGGNSLQSNSTKYEAKSNIGCHTCRRRRVKCDEARPACQRCLKGNFECEGYVRDLKFVDEKSSAQKRVLQKREAYLESMRKEVESGSASSIAMQRRGSSPSISDVGLAPFRDDPKLQFMIANLFIDCPSAIPLVGPQIDISNSNQY